MAASPARAKTPKPLLVTEQILEWLGIVESTLDRWIKNDPTFPVEYIGIEGERKLRRFDEDKVRAWMARDTDATAA